MKQNGDTYWWYGPPTWPFYVCDRLTARQFHQNMCFVNNNYNTLKTLETPLYLTVFKTFKSANNFLDEHSENSLLVSNYCQTTDPFLSPLKSRGYCHQKQRPQLRNKQKR